MRNIFCVLIISLLDLVAMNVRAQSLWLTITGIRNSEGQILVEIFRDKESYQTENAFMEKILSKTGVMKGEMSVMIDLKPGTYGITLLDDENSNSQMEYNFLGLPKEGFGFSENYRGFTKPKFDSIKFIVDRDHPTKIAIRVRYI